MVLWCKHVSREKNQDVAANQQGIFQAGGRKEERKRDSLQLNLSTCHQLWFSETIFLSKRILRNGRDFCREQFFQHFICHSWPLDLFYYFENKILISPKLFPGLCPSYHCIRKANSYSPSSSYKWLVLMAELSMSRLSSLHSCAVSLSSLWPWPHRIDHCISSYLWWRTWGERVCSSQICHRPILL